MKTLVVPLILCGLVFLAATAECAHGIERRAIGGQPDEAMKKIMEKGIVIASSVIEKLKDSEVARKLMGTVLGAVAGERGKRSVRIDAAVTNYNTAQYQKLELHKTYNKDAVENGTSCPLAQNELNWIETVCIAVQHALVEMRKIINGQKVGFNIAKPN